MKFEKRYWGTVALSMIIVIATIVLTPSAQIQDRYEVELDKTVIACEYLINGIWVQQFKGQIEPVNQSTFIIQWSRYDDPTIIKNATMIEPNARDYVIKLRVFYDVNTSRTNAVFVVAWYRGKELISIQTDEGFLVARDQAGIRVYIEDIEKVRYGSYDTGEFK